MALQDLLWPLLRLLQELLHRQHVHLEEAPQRRVRDLHLANMEYKKHDTINKDNNNKKNKNKKKN